MDKVDQPQTLNSQQAGPYSPPTVRAEASRLKPLFVDNIVCHHTPNGVRVSIDHFPKSCGPPEYHLCGPPE